MDLRATLPRVNYDCLANILSPCTCRLLLWRPHCLAQTLPVDWKLGRCRIAQSDECRCLQLLLQWWRKQNLIRRPVCYMTHLQYDLPDAGVGPDREADAERQRQRRAVARPPIEDFRTAMCADRLAGAVPDRRFAPRAPAACSRTGRAAVSAGAGQATQRGGLYAML